MIAGAQAARVARVLDSRMLPIPPLLPELLLGLACRRSAGIILNYHTLSHRDTRTHVAFLQRYFDFVSHGGLLRRLQHQDTPRRPFCFLTFDDGKKNNATEVAPALRALGVPAAFYIPTGFVSEGGRALWFDRVSALHTHVPELRSILQIEALKRLPCSLRDQQVDEACRRSGIDADLTNDEIRAMSWDDARSLHRQGFTIGAHSEWHSILTMETVEIAQADIATSMSRVSTELRARCVTFSFPNGSYTETLAKHAIACGADTVLTTEPLWTRSTSQPWRLPRIQLFGERKTAYLALKITAARLPGLLANPDGTGRRYARRDQSCSR